MSIQNNKINDDTLSQLNTKAFKKFGYVFDLPVGPNPYTYLFKKYKDEFMNKMILDFGCES